MAQTRQKFDQDFKKLGAAGPRGRPMARMTQDLDIDERTPDELTQCRPAPTRIRTRTANLHAERQHIDSQLRATQT